VGGVHWYLNINPVQTRISVLASYGCAKRTSSGVQRNHVSAEHVRHPLGAGGDFRVGARAE